MEFPWIDLDVSYLSTEQMVEVDRLMVEEFGIDLVRMMENAGRSLAHLARHRFLDGDPRRKTVVVLAGTGGNGGGAMVAARRLHGYGADVRVAVTAPRERMTPVAAQQLDMLTRLDLPVLMRDLPYATADLIIDGLVGYSLVGSLRGRAAELALWANDADAPVLALDIPSGLDATTGAVLATAVRATATMTLALPKSGLDSPDAASVVGELYLADISVPPQLYAEPSLALHVESPFHHSDIVRLR
jgi:NAD(P)H-hydrate epimerase